MDQDTQADDAGAATDAATAALLHIKFAKLFYEREYSYLE